VLKRLQKGMLDLPNQSAYQINTIYARSKHKRALETARLRCEPCLFDFQLTVENKSNAIDCWDSAFHTSRYKRQIYSVCVE